MINVSRYHKAEVPEEQTIKYKVEKQAEVLDRDYPKWFESIDTEKLNMFSICDCIGGQLEGLFSQFCAINDIQPEDMDAYCASPNVLNASNIKGAGKILKNLWLKEIQKRKKELV